MKSSWILRSLSSVAAGICLVSICVLTRSPAYGQFGEQGIPVAVEQNEPLPTPAAGEPAPSTLIEIPNEPKTVDPATVISPALAARVTVSFKGQPLRDIVKWLQTERSLNVLVDYRAMAEEGMLAGEPITDHLDDSPLYLLLDRLQEMRLGWFVEDDTLNITTLAVANEHTTTIPYNVGDLFDAGYKPQAVLRTIPLAVPGTFADGSEDSTIVLLGDVIFVRQTDAGHQKVAGLLSALRKHGRRTFILDSPQHEILRAKLEQKVTIDFDETPLNAVIRELARQVDADLRLDTRAMAEDGISELTPVTLKMTNISLSVALRAITSKHLLSWILHDGILKITTATLADEVFSTAVFDVRDLCRNTNESNGLMRAVRTQTRGKWEQVDGEGGSMACPLPGVLMVRNADRTLDELLRLLENYRVALRASKPRASTDVDPKEIVTKYYRLQKEIALDLERLLPELVQPESWKSPARPSAVGTIRSVSSTTGNVGGNPNANPSATPASVNVNGLFIANSVLIISQSREVHDSIEGVVRKVQFGDSGGALRPQIQTGGMGGMGGGMGGMGGGMGGGAVGGGGFGGGFFSVPKK